MTVNRTTLLDLPLPVTGTESGTWGDTTNNGLSQYMDIAIAGMNSLTSANFTAGALTIANTLGDSSATNIAAGSAQYATIKVSSLAVNSTITAPSSNRSYRIINADATYSLTIKASGQTGVTFLPGQTGVVAFNGTDYVIVGVVGAGSTTDNTVPRFDGTTGEILQSSGVTIDDSNNVSGVAQLNITTLDATNIEVTNIKAKDGTAAGSIADSTGVVTLASSVLTTTDINGGTIDNTAIGGATPAAGAFTTLSASSTVTLSGGTANGVLYLNGSKVATSGSTLVFDGTNLGLGVTPSAWSVGKAFQLNSIDAALWGAGTSTYLLRGTYYDGGYKYTSTGVPARYMSLDDSGFTWFTAPSGTAGNAITFSQVMTLDASGNLGIGTSSPSQKLTVLVADAAQSTSFQAATGRIRFRPYVDATNGAIIDATNTAESAYIPLSLTGSVVRLSTGASSLLLDSSGNLGLGVTPSAWATYPAMQLAGGGVMGAGSDLNLSANGYFNAGWKRIATGAATLYNQSAGVHSWYNAVSGSAGAAISLTQAMTLDASGRLLVGTTNSSGTRLTVYGGAMPSGGDYSLSASTALSATRLTTDASGKTSYLGSYFDDTSLEISQGTTSGYVSGIVIGARSATNATVSDAIALFTRNTERARITSGGDLLVGTTDNSGTSGAGFKTLGGRPVVVNAGSTNATTVYEVYSTGAAAYRFYVGMDGTVYATNTTISAISDQRFKENIQDLDVGLNAVMALKPRKFDWKAGKGKDIKGDRGFIAQEFEQVFPDMIDEWKDPAPDGEESYKSVRADLIPVLIKAIQEQQALIESLTSRVAQLEGTQP